MDGNVITGLLDAVQSVGPLAAIIWAASTANSKIKSNNEEICAMKKKCSDAEEELSKIKLHEIRIEQVEKLLEEEKRERKILADSTAEIKSDVKSLVTKFDLLFNYIKVPGNAKSKIQ